MNRRRSTWLILAGIAAACVLWLAPIAVSPTGVPHWPKAVYTDLLVSHLPNAVYSHESIFSDSEFPLWNRMILSGAPFAADPLAGLWYLPNWILIFFPTALSFNLVFLLHLIWAGVGMWLFTRRLGLAQPGALLAAIAFSGSPKLVGHVGLGHIGLFSAVCWTPWILLVLTLTLEVVPASFRKGLFYAALTGVILGIVFLADPRWFIPVVLLSMGYALACAFHRALDFRAHSAPILVVLLTVGLFSLAVSAVLAIPLIEFTLNSTRSLLDPLAAGEYDLPLARLIGFIFPEYGGWAEWMTYSGILVLFLAMLALFKSRSWSYFWWGAVIISVIVALGDQTALFGLFVRFLPGAGLLRVPPRSLFIASFALSVLAGYGLETLRTAPDSKQKYLRLTIATFWIFVILLSLGAVFLVLQSNAASSPQVLHPFLIPLLFGLISSGFLIARFHNPAAHAWTHIVLIALVVVDLALINASLNESRIRDPGQLRKIEEIGALGTDNGSRFFSISYSLTQPEVAQAGLELADGVNPLQLANYWNFMSEAVGFDSEIYSVTLPPFTDGQPETPRSFDLDLEKLGWLGVDLIVASYPITHQDLNPQLVEEGLYVYWNPRSRPQAWIQRSADRIETAWQPVKRIAVSRNRLEFLAQGPGTLVLSEVSFPGWRAYRNGQRVELDQMENLFRKVDLPGGEHHVRVLYVPLSLYSGLVVTVFGFFGLFLLWRRT